MKRTIYACDRCRSDIASDEPRYVVQMSPRHGDPAVKEFAMDLCGFCAGQIRWALHEADPKGKLICHLPDEQGRYPWEIFEHRAR